MANPIQEACEEIERGLANFLANADHVTDLQLCLSKLAWLRQQYRADAEAVSTHVERIKGLRQRVRQALLSAREHLTAKFLEASEAATAWAAARDACRDALVELSNTENFQRLDCPRGWIEIKHAQTMLLPKIGTAHREQLLAIIADAQLWPQVGFPSAARLSKAIAKGLFSPQQTGEIVRLCPAQTTCRLMSHRLD